MVLLDTCAAIWLAEGAWMSAASRRAVESAIVAGGVLISPVSAWEIGALSARGQVEFTPSPFKWFADLMARPGLRLEPLTPEIAMGAWFLPGPLHGDPADRLLISTARSVQAPLVTRDRRILGYAKAGHLRAIAC